MLLRKRRWKATGRSRGLTASKPTPLFISLIECGLVFDAKYPGTDDAVIGLNEFYICKTEIEKRLHDAVHVIREHAYHLSCIVFYFCTFW